MSGVLVEDVSFSALLPLKWSPPAKGNRPILPHEQIIFSNGRQVAVVRHERISPVTNRHGYDNIFNDTTRLKVQSSIHSRDVFNMRSALDTPLDPRVSRRGDSSNEFRGK
ncbi:hypothetical protein G5I_00172 [Acromyrmex echinatior]|uniref:Uncharacterized protein n=1 Tax=Acromyrmex echinatior TaxID=103372 RepID=F4W467_ACREC|nr:hypothetical protein G5I_00172 [Acromyrmex echinatior]